MGNGSCPSMARSASGTAIPTPPGPPFGGVHPEGRRLYGYRLHAAVCSRTGLPLAWEVKTAREHESLSVVPLLDALDARGFAPETAALDRGYDLRFVYEACETRGIAPIIPLRETANVKRGHHRPPECEHGTWTFSGADFKRKRAKWRCPSGGCQPPPSGSRPIGCSR